MRRVAAMTVLLCGVSAGVHTHAQDVRTRVHLDAVGDAPSTPAPAPASTPTPAPTTATPVPAQRAGQTRPSAAFSPAADESGGAQGSDAGDDDQVLMSETLPSALQEPTRDRLPPVEGPIHLEADPRVVRSVPPWDVNDYRTRFFPTWSWAREPDTLTLSAERQDVRVTWSPQAGACYVVLAVDPTLEAYAERSKTPGFRWYEVGNDIDVQIRRASDGRLIAEDLTREAFPRVAWCSDGEEVQIDFRLPIPEEADPTVNVVWGVAVDTATLPPLRFDAANPLLSRLMWAHSVVVPRGKAISAPVVFQASGPSMVQMEFPRPRAGCEAVIAVGEPTVEALALTVDNDPKSPGDYGGTDLAAIRVCADDDAPALVSLLVAVRAGEGRVAVQRFSP